VNIPCRFDPDFSELVDDSFFMLVASSEAVLDEDTAHIRDSADYVDA
jgi:hypothetical protein